MIKANYIPVLEKRKYLDHGIFRNLRLRHPAKSRTIAESFKGTLAPDLV
jgi:hypothetical protein